MTDSIDTTLLDHYQRELTWLRRAGQEFAQRYPKVGQRLALSASECADPHVERLLEGFALLTARLQRRLDDGYGDFSNALLEQLYPLALRPVPSCGIVRFQPDATQGTLKEGFHLPRDTPLFTANAAGESLYFRTSYPVTLWPLEITAARFLGAEETQAFTGIASGQSALRIDLQTLGEHLLPELPITSLRLHLGCAARIVAELTDLLQASVQAVLCGLPDGPLQPVAGEVSLVGFAEGEQLLPDEESVHPALRLLYEYFAFTEKFAFFDVPLAIPPGATTQLSLYLVFQRLPRHLPSLHRDDLQLGCTPVVNLFPRTAEPLRPSGTQSEYRMVADAHRENSVEIHSVRSLRAMTETGVVDVAPYYGHGHQLAAACLYWHARRSEGLNPSRRGSDMLLSLVDTHLDPAVATAVTSLTAEVLCTNRGQAQALPAGANLSFERPGPVARIQLLRKPSDQVTPDLQGASRWQLVSLLALNQQSLVEGPGALEALKEMLALHNLRGDDTLRRQIQGISGLTTRKIMDRVGDDAWRGWRQGYEVRLTLDPEAFHGTSPVLFAAVVARFLTLYVSANCFVRTVLILADKEIKTWQPWTGNALLL